MAGLNTLRKTFLFTFAALTLVTLPAQNSFAWGLRGHHTVCEAAIFNINEAGLQTFGKTRIVMAGHLCNIPDTSWKSKSAEITGLGSPAHFINPEKVGVLMKDLGSDYLKLQSSFEGTENKYRPGKIISLHREMGSLWWRADQFVRLATEQFSLASKQTPPANKAEEQDMKLPYNQSVSQGMVRLFLTGHFVGDAGQPFHSSADYDGYDRGHGGIHSFYEETVVDEQDDKFAYDVAQEAKRLRKLAAQVSKMKSPTAAQKKEVAFLLADTPVNKMRELSMIASSEAPAVLKLDKLKKASTLVSEKGMEIKTPAERELTPQLAKSFRPLLVKHMGRSAALLASFWDDVYVKAGRPNLKAYKNYYYPFEPEFIAPDYLKETQQR